MFRAFGAIFIQLRVFCIHLEALWNDLPPEADFFTFLTSQMQFSKGKTMSVDHKTVKISPAGLGGGG